MQGAWEQPSSRSFDAALERFCPAPQRTGDLEIDLDRETDVEIEIDADTDVDTGIDIDLDLEIEESDLDVDALISARVMSREVIELDDGATRVNDAVAGGASLGDITRLVERDPARRPRSVASRARRPSRARWASASRCPTRSCGSACRACGACA
ncbi:MAG: hypothetical protein Q8O67_32510 [Deltaproteobacteria bacterium]|nr:hypothetical protein [Deltaproteobacteria bacterium]